MMTIEKASEIILKESDRDKKIDLFCDFVEEMDIMNEETLKLFAKMSGFLIAIKVEVIK